MRPSRAEYSAYGCKYFKYDIGPALSTAALVADLLSAESHRMTVTKVCEETIKLKESWESNEISWLRNSQIRHAIVEDLVGKNPTLPGHPP